MRLGPNGLSLIKEFESLALKAYLCPAGKWTISYGVTGPNIVEGMTLTAAEAEAMFLRKLVSYEETVRDACSQTTQCQFDAMTSLCYNIGQANFRKSSVVRLHNKGDYIAASRAFNLWTKATSADGTKRDLRGLVRRRSAEAALYMTDDGKDEPQRKIF